MKRVLFLTTTLLFSVFSFAYEYVNDKFCIYRIDVGEQTAEVVNFCNEASSITIPSSFVYKGDKYIVEKISEKSFRDDYDMKYCYYDYDKIRSSIVELILPPTLKEIGFNAFEGMRRLKEIVIPSRVKMIKDCFGRNARLEKITLEGLPCIELYSWNGSKICLSELFNPIKAVDSIENVLTIRCPKLKKLEVLPLNEYIVYSKKLDLMEKSYSKQLKDTVSLYKILLRQHPYYAEEDPSIQRYVDESFNDVVINKPILMADNAKEKYKIQSNALSSDYNKKISLCKQKYQALNRDMEKICKEKSPSQYVNLYCSYNPDFSARVEEMLKDYKCEYTKQSLALALLNNQQLKRKCQDSLWEEYSYLFKTKDEFLTLYDESSNIKADLNHRQTIYNKLKNTIQSYSLSIRGAYDSTKDDWSIRAFRRDYDEMKKQSIPVSEEIIRQDPKAQKEYEKNGVFFSSLDEFFAAYVTKDYNKILKENKKSKK